MFKDVECPNCGHKGAREDWILISFNTSSGYSTLGCHVYSQEREMWLNSRIDLFGCPECNTVVFKTRP